MKSNKQNLSFLIILSGLMACTSLTTDIYLPAMPTMERELHGDAEWTITGFLIGFAIAQLLWGPISDKVGRKKPLYMGMFLFIVGSVGCACSQTILEVTVWRILQALGACVGPMLSRTMIRDLYEKSEAAQMLSTLIIIMAIAPIAGPLIGGALLKIASWNAIFWLMVVIGFILLLCVLKLPETLSAEKRATGSIVSSFVDYSKLLTNRSFVTYTLCVTFFYIAVYAFITGSSFVYINYFHVRPEYYGFLFGVNIIGITIISAANRKLVKKYPLDKLLIFSTLIATLGAGALLVCSLTRVGGIFGIIIPVFIIFSMNGIVAACSNAAALDAVSSDVVGSAAALLGSLQYGSGIISSALLALFSDGTPETMVWIMVLAVFLSTVMALMNIKKVTKSMCNS